MTMFARARPSSWLRLGLIALCMLCSGACLAKSTGVDEDAALQSGPCYQALVDRNVSQPTTAPNRELGAACQAENGDVERAWARVVRLWGSDSAEVPDYDNYVRSDAGVAASPIWKGLSLVGMLLVYAVCGTPLRSAARPVTAVRDRSRSAGAAVALLVLRGLLGSALLWLSGISFLTLAGGLALVAIVARSLRAPDAKPRLHGREDATNGANGFAVFAADAINDVVGAAPGLLGLALLAQHDGRWLAVGVALAVVASLRPVIRTRRRLRANALATTMAGGALAAVVGAFAELDPAVAGWVGRAAPYGMIAPFAFAAVVVASGWRHLGFGRPSLKSEARPRI